MNVGGTTGILQILGSWCLVSVVTALAIGAVIRAAQRETLPTAPTPQLGPLALPAPRLSTDSTRSRVEAD